MSAVSWYSGAKDITSGEEDGICSQTLGGARDGRSRPAASSHAAA